MFRFADISDSVRVQRALIERNEALETADRLKTEFLANISYELRTPLTTIIGFAEILDKRFFGPLNERQGEYASGIVSASGTLLTLIDDILDTGLTLHFLARTLALRNPASLSAVTLFDRPYRRLVDDLPLPYIGFTVPDELLAGYGLGLEERWRALPNVHFVTTDALPSAAADAA